jgi:hypothetical protein
MTPRLTAAEYVGGYRIRLSYEDGTRGEVDLENELWGEVFEPLRDVERFKTFRIDRELGTLVWPNGADLAPEFLYRKVAA